jgi:hypothetical protein
MDLNRTLVGAALVAALTCLATPANAQWTAEPIGRTGVLHLRTAPFPHVTRPQYRDDRVLAFVPVGYEPGEVVDLVVHYHGHWAETVSSAKARRLREQLAASGKAAVLLCPQGPLRAGDSAGGKHELRDGLKRFLDEALEALARDGVVPVGARPGRVILSGHSGAYRVISKCLERGGVDVQEVWLHDAVYGAVPTFTGWAAQPRRRLVSTHTPNGGTRANNGALRRELLALHMPVVVREADLEGASIAILAVPEGHNEVTKRLERFLRTSGLEDVSPADDASGLVDRVPH